MIRRTFASGVLLLGLVVLVACANQKNEPAAQSAQGSGQAKGEKKMVFQPIVAGRFYTGNPNELLREVDQYISKAAVPDLAEDPMGIISPHAGYAYSGPVAGYAFQAVKGKSYETVVILGISHRVPGSVSVLDYEAYHTPLGDLPIDRESSKKLAAAAPWINADESLFASEHSLEVQLPFVQRTLSGVNIVMISMRSQSLSASSM